MPEYEYLEHTADLFFRSYGKSLSECYVNAARAMSAAIVDLKTIYPSDKREISLEAKDLPNLMHDWLDQLLFLFDTEGLIFRDYEVSVASEGGKYSLKAKATGEPFDRRKHVILTAIKAITYHDLKVEEQDGVWTAEVLCDI